MICQRACIEFKSLLPHIRKPYYFSAGGYSAISEDGRYFCFDWEESSGSSSYDENGYIVVEMFLKYMDEFSEEDNLENGVKPEELTAEFLSKSTLTEVHFESSYDDENNEEDDLLRFELTSFEFAEWNDVIQEYEAYSIPEEEIDRYNKNEGINENFWELKKAFSNKLSLLKKIENLIKTGENSLVKISSIEKEIQNAVSSQFRDKVKLYSIRPLLYFLFYCSGKEGYDYQLIENFAQYCLERTETLKKLS